MIRTKLGLLGLCAVMVGMMAMSASSAQATLAWLVLNAAKTESSELKAALIGWKDSTHVTLDSEIAGLKIAITCTNFTPSGFNLQVGGKLTEGGKAVFTGCKVFKEAPLKAEYTCTVKSPFVATGTIETNELKGELVLIGSEVQAKIQPKTGPDGSFATLRLEGFECPLAESNFLHGTLYLKDCLGLATSHATSHLVEAGASTALYIGGHSAKQLEVTKGLGSAWVELGGAHEGLGWSAADV